MNGWQFMKSYEELVIKNLQNQITIVLVTISDNQEDKDRAITNKHIADF